MSATADDGGPDATRIRALGREIRTWWNAAEGGDSMSLTITLRCSNGKQYETVLHVRKESNGEETSFYIENDCIQIFAAEEIETKIESNTHPEPCFRPRVMSEPQGQAERLTTTDILQVLKTKLCFLIPGYRHYDTMTLMDAAKDGGVVFTPYRLLRGGWPLYWKYGYQDSHIVSIRSLLITLRGRDVSMLAPYKIAKDYLSRKGRSVDDSELLTSILQKVSFEEERDDIRFLSNILFKAIIQKYGFQMPYHYVFQESSPEWKEWRSRVVLTEYTFRPPTTTYSAMSNNETGGHRGGVSKLCGSAAIRRVRRTHTRRGGRGSGIV